MENLDWITVDINETLNVTCSNSECELNYPCSSSFSCQPYKLTLSEGVYLVDVFGAEGVGAYSPGKGGEIKGILSINKNTTFYAYIGAKGASGQNWNVQGAFGGGGSGYGYETFHYIGSGGGASDLRTIEKDLHSRVIVAGGGGGGGQLTGNWNLKSPGGDGSGFNGNSATSQKGIAGSGAFVTGPGANGVKGSFGFGGNVSNYEGHDGSGGGGGYYGGNAGYSHCSGGGGGSGYYNRRLIIHHESFTGVRKGHGMIKITKLFTNSFDQKTCLPRIPMKDRISKVKNACL